MELAGASILFGSTNHAWAGSWTFYQMLACALARENDVVYVDSPVSLARLRRGDLPLLGGARADVVPAPRLRVLRSVNLPLQRTQKQRDVASALTARAVGRWARRTGFEPDLVSTYVPLEYPLVSRFPRAHVLYWTGDEVTMPNEERILARADAVLCVSEPMFERRSATVGARAHFVAVACDFDRYHAARHAAKLPELRSLPRPILGYSGFVNARLDVDLLIGVARRLPEATVAIVGPTALPATDESRLRACANVVFLGPQPAERVPHAIRTFDVGLIPYRDIEFNRNSNPVKFYEYLALGKPVVATDIPTLRRFAHVASVGPADTFVERAAAAAAGDAGDVETRYAVARAHSFDALLAHLRALPL
ncbi:MAG TPA: glycosyltransferase [Gaiellaceae bacterium]|nr:glycosyltransferase [Gaiellaceae bacterium]